MGIPLFTALGQLGSQWGQAKEELTQEHLRTQTLAAQMKRQETMQQLEQQRLTNAQEQLALAKQRVEGEAKGREATQSRWEQEGWLDPFVYRYRADGKLYEKNLRLGAGNIREADPGRETEAEKWTREHGAESKAPQYELRDTEKGLQWFRKPTTGGEVIPTGQKGRPPASAVGAPTPQELQQGYQDTADLIKGGMDYTKATSNLPKYGKLIVDRLLKAQGYIYPTEHTTQNMNTLSSIQQFQPVMNALEDALKAVDPKTGRPLYEDNTNTAAARERIQWFVYNTLGKKPSDPLLSSIIGYGAFAQIAGTTPWMRAGRGAYIMALIRQHLPDAEKNTPAAMWDRLQRLKNLLSRQENVLRVVTLGGLRQPNGMIKPIGDIDYSMIDTGQGQGGGPVNPDDYKSIFQGGAPRPQPQQ